MARLARLSCARLHLVGTSYAPQLEYSPPLLSFPESRSSAPRRLRPTGEFCEQFQARLGTEPDHMISDVSVSLRLKRNSAPRTSNLQYEP